MKDSFKNKRLSDEDMEKVSGGMYFDSRPKRCNVCGVAMEYDHGIVS